MILVFEDMFTLMSFNALRIQVANKILTTMKVDIPKPTIPSQILTAGDALDRATVLVSNNRRSEGLKV